MVQTKRFPLSGVSLLAAGAMCLPAGAQSIAVQGVSPATSMAQSGQTDIHLSPTAHATTSAKSGLIQTRAIPFLRVTPPPLLP